MRVPENHWYPIAESREVRGRPVGMERLGRRFVLWRSADGTLHVQDERCPHLGASLSAGQVAGDALVCPFHGMHFGTDGRCRLIPANGRNGRVPVGMAVHTYRCCEHQGFIWLWWGDAARATASPPWFEALQGDWHQDTTTVDWPVHYTRAIENQLDVAHVAFVHRTTIGRGGRSLVEGPYVEASDNRIRVWVTNRVDDGAAPRPQEELATRAAGRPPSLDFLFPGLWLLHISDRLHNLIAFVPVNAGCTRYYLRSCHRIGPAWLARPFSWLLRASNRYVLRQDRAVVVTQTPASSVGVTGDRFISADRAIVQYRRMHARLLDGDPDKAADEAADARPP